MDANSSGLLRNPDFVKLWIGQTISEFGSRITRDALPFIAVVLLNATPTEMGLLNAATSLPILFFGLLAGVWVDRLRRRPLMLAVDCLRLLLLLIVPLAFFGGWLSLPLVFVVAALMSILGLVFETAYRALLPSLIRRDQLAEGNSKLSTTDSLAEIGGPALTGLLVQALGAPLAILFDTLSYLGSVFSLARIRKPEPPPTRSENANAVREIAEGVRTIQADADLRAIAVITGMRAFFGAGIGALYEILALRELGLTPAILGLLVSTGGIGALGGALLAGRLTRWFGTGRALIGALMINGLVACCLPLALAVPSLALPLLVIGQVAGDGAMMIYWINSLTLRQTRTPDHLLGRVNGSIGFLAEGIAPIGAILAGLSADHIGIQAVLWIIAGGIVVTAAYALRSPLRHQQ